MEGMLTYEPGPNLGLFWMSCYLDLHFHVCILRIWRGGTLAPLSLSLVSRIKPRIGRPSHCSSMKIIGCVGIFYLQEKWFWSTQGRCMNQSLLN